MKPISGVFILLYSFILACQSQQSQLTLDANGFNDKLKSTENAQLIDVRTPEEFEQGLIYNAKNIDYNNNFESTINTLDKNQSYFVYCLSGGRSTSAANYMRKNGFTNVYDLKGGIMAWQNKNLPISKTANTPNSDKISVEDYTHMITSDTLVLVDFYAPWCIPCKKMESMLAELSKEQAGKVKIIRVNIDENKQLAKQLAIEEIPVFKLFKKGTETWMYKGKLEKEDLVKVIAKN